MTREEAIAIQKAMRDNLHETGKDYPYRDDMIPLMKKSCDMAIQALEQESKTGQWVKIKPYPLQMHDYECSECGHETDDNTENYCSDCGARMVKSQESEG